MPGLAVDSLEYADDSRTSGTLQRGQMEWVLTKTVHKSRLYRFESNELSHTKEGERIPRFML